MSAVITLSDDSTINVTSGYYEVGKSVPITTLITVYDSLGGKHEFTLLLDKDSSTVDANLVAGSEADESVSGYSFNGKEYTVTRAGNGTDEDPYVFQYTDAAGTAHNLDVSDVTMTYTDTNGDTYNVTVTGSGTTTAPYVYRYTDANGQVQILNESDVAMTYTADTSTVTKNPDGTYTYTDANGDTVTVDESDVTAIFDNRWRAHIAPDIGKKGPAAGEYDATDNPDGFQNSYTRSAATENPEADGSSTVGVMNNINYLYFSNTGQFISNGQDELGSVSFTYSDGNGAAEQNISVNFLGMTQYANSTTCFPMSDGNTAGILQSLAVDGNGVISGTYTNGLVRAEAQIAVAQFNNSSGLTKVGTTIYTESNNSGSANVKTISDFGLNVVSSALEMSNVDLATEFSDMIITQRGFQANSKMTTVSDEMLETLVNMKR